MRAVSRALLAAIAGAVVGGMVPRGVATAQHPAELRGTVVDSASRRPIADVQLSLFVRPTVGARVLEARARTDSAGHFQISNADVASSILELRRIGFAPIDVLVDTVKRRDAFVIALVPLPARLDEVRVVDRTTSITTSQRRLEVSGFVQRRQAGIGKFLDSTRVARAGVTTLVSLLRPYLKGCTMIFVDGLPGRLQDVDIATVIGIEIYASNLEAPPNFYNRVEGAGRCGAIAVWR